MIAVISPAKTLDTRTFNAQVPYTMPQFQSNAYQLVKKLKKIKTEELMQLMDLSEKLAVLNTERYRIFKKEHTTENSTHAILTFKGDVYQGLQADTFNADDLNFAQNHLRILSGLYGILRPLDLMQPYRLEMGTRLETEKAENLYSFWGDKITKALNDEIRKNQYKYVINLASQEYWQAVQPKKLRAGVINVEFHEERNGKISFVSFNAKRARGMMCHYIVKNKITNPELLKGFDYDGYYFAENLSNDQNFRFLK
jgi:cytoplasmic iron level regulating protein YaaA (DUF328/UPF0246 family)